MCPFKEKESFWENRFNDLATFNSEIGRGILHTKVHKEKMKLLQEEYNKKYAIYNKGKMFI